MRKILSGILAILALQSCTEKGLDTFTEGPSIYFYRAGTPESGAAPATDSLFYSFSYGTAGQQEYELPVYLSVLGRLGATEQPYKLEVVDSMTTAVEGEDYVLEDDGTFAPGINRDSVIVRMLRSANLRKETRKLTLRLLANETFDINMTTRMLVLTNKRINFNTCTVYFNDIDAPPPFWPTAFFGKYSKKKLQLLSTTFGFDFENDFQKTPPGPTGSIDYMTSGVIAAQRYLNDMRNLGTPVLEDDGTPMVMGSIAQ
ncbi:DUF4843 domain-containing protein [Chitinophaga lutea]